MNYCASTVLSVLEWKSVTPILQSELARLTIRGVSRCMSTELIAWGGDEGVTPPI